MLSQNPQSPLQCRFFVPRRELFGGLEFILHEQRLNQDQGTCVSTIAIGCPIHAVNLCLLTSQLANHTGVEPARMRTIDCTVYVLPLPGLELTPALLALVKQQCYSC